MKVLGFAVIVLGLVIAYIGITGSQHSVMAILRNSTAMPSGKKISPSGQAGTGNAPQQKGGVQAT